jgi:hypothetical protein
MVAKGLGQVGALCALKPGGVVFRPVPSGRWTEEYVGKCKGEVVIFDATRIHFLQVRNRCRKYALGSERLSICATRGGRISVCLRRGCSDSRGPVHRVVFGSTLSRLQKRIVIGVGLKVSRWRSPRGVPLIPQLVGLRYRAIQRTSCRGRQQTRAPRRRPLHVSSVGFRPRRYARKRL